MSQIFHPAINTVAKATIFGARFILTPGCSVPNDSQPDELHRLHRLFAPGPVRRRLPAEERTEQAPHVEQR